MMNGGSTFWGFFPCRTDELDAVSKLTLNKCLQKFYLAERKRDGRSVIARQKLLSLATVNELKIIIFVLNYLTVLVFTKTIINLIVSG